MAEQRRSLEERVVGSAEAALAEQSYVSPLDVLSAVVVRFSRSRRRYERIGLLVEEAALGQAEQDCLADEACSD